MKRIDKLVFATNNAHKLQEARAILGDDITLISLAELGCNEDIPETSDTLEGNALQKARWVHDRYGVDCIADDTGLMVDALGGAPGVHSARYAGPGHDSAANMAKLLHEMSGRTDRDAHFSTVLALVADGEEHTFEGRVDGTIAETPSGKDGFGYDPVFIAAESGKTFADMTAEDKNAISHRGRAFRTFASWLRSLAMIIVMLLLPGIADAEQWRMLPSYDGKVLRAIDTPDYTYFLTLKRDYIPRNDAANQRYGQLLRYDKENEEWQWLDRSTGLSEHVVVDADYDFSRRQLTIGYDNGNIDLLKDNGEVINIPGLKMADSNASQEIQSIFTEPDGDVYIATATGYVSIDPAKGEIRTSRDFGSSIYCVGKFKGKLFVGTEDGLYQGDERSGNLDTYKRVGTVNKVKRILPWGKERMMIYFGDSWHMLANSLRLIGGEFIVRGVSLGSEYDISTGRNGIITWGIKGVRWLSDETNEYAISEYPLPLESTEGSIASVDGRNIWFVDGRKGISRMSAPANDGGTWTTTIDRYIPQASNAFRCVAMTYSPTYGMLVRNPGMEQEFSSRYLLTPDLISSLKDGVWKPMSLAYSGKDPQNVFQVYNPMGLSIDPLNKNHVYCGSMMNGLLRYDLENPEKSLHMSRPNDEGAGKNGFVTVTDICKAWNNACMFSTPRFDKAGNMWVTYNNPDKNNGNSLHTELWCWTPEDRAATTGSSNFRPFKKQIYNNIPSRGGALLIPLMYSGHTNWLIYNAGNYAAPTVIIDTNGTPGNTADDTMVQMTSFVDQDNTSFDYGSATSLTEDPATGRVWVTANKGVYHFNPADLKKGVTQVRRVKVARNDGTNLADYLLDGVYVSMMTPDNNGRKWFGTYGAGIVVTSSDGREIVKTYTTDNSDIPDDIIYGIAHNPANNSMMISTGKGLCELYLDGTDSDGESDVRAYPNPVRPGYMGLVTIDSLPDDATVKIVDGAGNLVKEIGMASGGSITWDVTNMFHKRVPGGVYYILANNGPDSDSYSKMGKILVVE